MSDATPQEILSRLERTEDLGTDDRTLIKVDSDPEEPEAGEISSQRVSLEIAAVQFQVEEWSSTHPESKRSPDRSRRSPLFRGRSPPEEVHIRRSLSPFQRRIWRSRSPPRRSPSPARRAARRSPSPARREARKSPSPARRATRRSPSPARRVARRSPSPARREARRSPSPDRRAIRRSPPARDEAKRSPSPDRRSARRSPSPARREARRSPSPNRGSARRSPSAARREARRTPSPDRRATRRSPSPARDEARRSPFPARRSARRSPSPARRAARRSFSPARREARRSPSPNRRSARRSPSPARRAARRSPSPARRKARRSPSPARRSARRSPSPAPREARRSPSPDRGSARRSPSPPSKRPRHSTREDEESSSNGRYKHSPSPSRPSPDRKRKRSSESPPNEGSKRSRQSDAPLGRTGGIYIPPFKLAMMRKGEAVKNSVEFQREYWEALRKSINGYVNKANLDNIPKLVEEMFKENLIRARGILARAILRAQLASPTFTNVFTALLAVINSKLPIVGKLLITRLILQFRRAYNRNDKIVTLACVKFLAHLINQRVLSEVTGLELCALLLESPTNDGVEVCCGFLQESGQILSELQPQALNLISERLRSIMVEGDVDMRTQYTIEKLFEFKRSHFRDFPGVLPQLDLIEEDDQITHTIDLLDESLQREELLDVFKAKEPDEFAAEESKWASISHDVLADESSMSDDSSVDSEAEALEQKYRLEDLDKMQKIQDCSEQDLVNLRKTVYLCIMSSASYEECVHKLLKLNIPEGQETEVCIMLIDCCAMERTFSLFFALQAERLCRLKVSYQYAFLDCFKRQYQHVHRLETNKLRNVAKFFAHLFSTEALPWTAFEILVLTDEATTAASRIFIKILFQDLADDLGLDTLQTKLRSSELQPVLHKSLFPRDSLPNVRFSINFFTAIGLGALADDLRSFLQVSRTSPTRKCKVTCERPRRRGRTCVKDDEDLSYSSSSSEGSVSSGDVSSAISVGGSDTSDNEVSEDSGLESSSESDGDVSDRCPRRRNCRVVCKDEKKNHCAVASNFLGPRGSTSSARTRESRSAD